MATRKPQPATTEDIDRLRDTMDRWRVTIQVEVDKHKHDLYGNGEPGMDERIRQINGWIDDQKKTAERRREWWNRLQWVIIPMVATAVFVFIGQAIYFYFDIVPKLQALP